MALPSAVAQVVVATVAVGDNPYGVAVNSMTNKIYVPNCGIDPSCTANLGIATVIDGASNTVIKNVTVGVRPEAVAVNLVTNKIYVANNCGTDKTCGSVGSVTVIDANNNYSTVNVPVEYFPIALAVDSATNRIYVVNSCGTDFECGSAGTVSVIDGGTNKVVATVNADYSPEAIAINSGINQIYVVNNCGDAFRCVNIPGTVTVIDGASNNVLTTVNVGVYPNALDLDSATNKVYVSNSCGSDFQCKSAGTVTAIDANNNYSTVSVPVGYDPRALAVNSVTHQKYVSNYYGNDPNGHSAGTVTVIDANDDNNTATVNVGYYPGALAIDSSVDEIYVTNSCGNDGTCMSPGTVTAINGVTNSTVSVGVGNDPSAVAVNAATDEIYVVNKTDGTVSVIAGTAQYTLTVTTSGNGQVTSTDGNINCPGQCSYNYPFGTPVTLNATPATGWTFGGWSGDCSGTGSCNLTMNQNHSVAATFTQQTYQLLVTVSGSGTVASTDGHISCPGQCSYNYPSGTPVTLNATPATGWTFSGWSGDCSGTGSCNLTMNQNHSVGATFTENSYVLTVSTIGNGTVTSTDGFINCPGMCSHSYLYNTPVTLNATPAQGWNFSGWSGACSGAGSCNLTMTQNQSVSATFVGNVGFQFVPVTPCRLVDTRTGSGGGGPIQGGTFQTFNLPNLAESGKFCPAFSLASAAAYSLNVSVVPQGPLGYLTIWPTGEQQPTVSTLNSVDGRVKANAAIVPAGTNGAVNVFVSNTTDVVLDIDGYFAPANPPSTLAFYPLTPCRIADTRNSNGPLGGPSLQGGVERDFPVQSNTDCVIPSTAQAYSFNFTAVPVGGQPLGYLTVWPTGQTQPVVSTLNDLTGTVVANAAIVPAGQPNGEVAVFPSNNTDLVIDVNGYFAPPGAGGLSLYPVVPCRVLDTRNGNGAFSGTLSPPVDVVDSICAPPGTAQAYVFNATVVPSVPLGYLTLWPDDGSPPPGVATLNAVDGAVTSNMAIVPTTNGKINAFASNLTQLILDISSYFAP